MTDVFLLLQVFVPGYMLVASVSVAVCVCAELQLPCFNSTRGMIAHIINNFGQVTDIYRGSQTC